MPKLNVVAILPLIGSNDARILHGAIEAARQQGDAELYVWSHWHCRGGGVGLPASAGRLLSRFGIRGILADIWTAPMMRGLRRLHVPVVDIGGDYPSDVTAVHVDNAALGRMAARHLLDQGLKSFGFWGQHCGKAYRRRDAFVATLRKAGFACPVFEKDVIPVPWSEKNEGPARRWLQSLPKPAGVMCWYDWQAVAAQYVCRQAGLRIPDEVALIGVDNDDLWRLQCPVPLTSIDTNAERIGYRAMQMLCGMMRSGRRLAREVLLPPGNVVARQSTDLLAIDNPEIVEAVRFIQSNSDRPTTVRDVLKAVPISRRKLEIRFLELLGRTPHQQIQHAHIERAKMLMEDYEMSLADVAEMSGFKTQSAFSALFKLLTQCTPGQYRRGRLQPKATSPSASSA